jgi:hypothetical protein
MIMRRREREVTHADDAQYSTIITRHYSAKPLAQEQYSRITMSPHVGHCLSTGGMTTNIVTRLSYKAAQYKIIRHGRQPNEKGSSLRP